MNRKKVYTALCNIFPCDPDLDLFLKFYKFWGIVR